MLLLCPVLAPCAEFVSIWRDLFAAWLADTLSCTTNVSILLISCRTAAAGQVLGRLVGFLSEDEAGGLFPKVSQCFP